MAGRVGGGPRGVGTLQRPRRGPVNCAFSADGKSLIGTAYYTGVSSGFTFELATQTYEVVSNASTGFFHPMPQPDGSMLVYEYTGHGLTPSKIVPQKRDDLGTVEFLGTRVIKTHPEVKEWGVGSPARVDPDSLSTERGKSVP